MAYQSHEDTAALKDESPTSSSDDITEKAAVIFELKQRIHKTAIDNIHKAQEKYKHYDPKVNV